MLASFNPFAARTPLPPTLTRQENLPPPDLSIYKTTISLARKAETYLAVAGIVSAIYFSTPLSIVLLTAATILTVAKIALIPTGSFLDKLFYMDRVDLNAQVTLSDGTILRGIWKTPRGENPTRPEMNEPDLSNRRIVVFFHGNAMVAGHNSNYDSMTGGKYDLLEMDYRGCVRSGGYRSSNAQHVADGVDIVKACLSQGYSLPNITLVGHSLGGSIAPRVKAYFDAFTEDGAATPSLIAHNTFYRLNTILSSGISYRIPEALVYVITKIVLKCMGWDYQFTQTEWDNLRENKIAIGGGDTDHLITPAVSLASHLTVDEHTVLIKDQENHMDMGPVCDYLHPEVGDV